MFCAQNPNARPDRIFQNCLQKETKARAKSKEQRAKSKEQRAKSKEWTSDIHVCLPRRSLGEGGASVSGERTACSSRAGVLRQSVGEAVSFPFRSDDGIRKRWEANSFPYNSKRSHSDSIVELYSKAIKRLIIGLK
jgi:hypothetical protein